MGKPNETEKTSRRGFLKLATTAAPAVAAATVLGAGEAEAAPATKSGGLQDTAHTRAYFDSARF
ncbi:MAG: ubiquinol-cytochrome c reductase iron-sulfur subunit N-terminal domain-containing protein [Albidovulum sp.]